MSVYKINDEEFIEIINSSPNISSALKAMKLNNCGANYDVLKRRCQKLNISIPSQQKQFSIRKTISNSEIILACSKATSRAALLKKLGLKSTGGANINWINTKINLLNIDICHWTGNAHLKGKTHDWSNKIPLEEILTTNSSYTNRHRLKKRLIKERLLNNSCYHCGINTWEGKKLSLHLDHINGINTDHRIDNLQLLCPNCHSLTPTYAGRNKKKK